MPTDRRPLIALAATLLAVVLVLWSCATGGDDDGGDDGSSPGPTTTEAGEDVPPGPEPPPAFVPITGGTDDDGQPQPPPIHATWSVVVRGDTSWAPYAGPELTGLDEEEAAAIAGRLRQLDAVLVEAGVPAGIELAYGPAAALCQVDPDLLDQLEDNGHRIGLYARSNGEAFRAASALADCGREATTASGLGAMSDPIGPDPPTAQTVIDATSMLAVLDIRQVVGSLSAVCGDTGLAEPAHGYGTGAFTAPWRSGWTDDRPCTDLVTGRIVMIDQTRLRPTEGQERIDADAVSALSAQADQAFAWALDHRFAEPEALPAPGVITWGVVVWLDDLIAPAPETDEDGEPVEGDGGEDAPPPEGEDTPPEGEDTPPVEGEDEARTAPLGDETLTLLRELFETWQPAVESERLVWMLPDDVAEIIRPWSNDG